MPFPFLAAAMLATPFVAAGANKLFSGSPGKVKQVPTLTSRQRHLQHSLERVAKGKTHGRDERTLFGQSANYWKDILNNDPESLEAFMDPEMRKFREQIMPELAEQYAGFGAGSGGLGGSNFANAAVNSGADLSERLAGLRASLRQNAASSLFNVGQAALTPYTQNIQTQAPSEGFLSAAAPGITQALTQRFMNSDFNQPQTTPSTPAVPQQGVVGGTNWLRASKFGTKNPYGGMNPSNFNPNTGMYSQ